MRLKVKHRVEGCDLVDADRRHIEELAHLVHRRARQPALLALGEIEHTNDRARLPARRIVRHQRLGLGQVFGCEGEARDLRHVLGIGGDHRHRMRLLAVNFAEHDVE